MVREAAFGSGITRHKVEIRDPNDVLEEILEQLDNPSPESLEPFYLWDMLHSIIVDYTQSLTRIEWHDVEDCPAWFSDEIMSRLTFANNLVKSKGVKHPSENKREFVAAVVGLSFFEIGKLCARAGLKFSWEPDALSGKRYRIKSDEGAEKRRGAYNEDTPKVLEEMKRLTADGHSVSRAAALAKKGGAGTSESANRALWYRQKRRERKL